MFQKIICSILSLSCALFIPIGLRKAQGQGGVVQPTALGPILATVILPTGAIHFQSSSDGIFQPVAAAPGIGMQVTLQFSVDLANRVVVVQSLDGADVSCNNPVIGADGTLQFTATPGAQGGLYRVQINLGDFDALFQLWVPTGDDPPLVVPDTTLPGT